MVNKEYYKLGQKIRNFRIRAGKSQMDLELEIGASAGSLSRIENGEVNPTKETLLKIANELHLNSLDATTLFDLDINEFGRLVKLAQNLNLLDIDKVLQSSVNNITAELNLLGAAVTEIRGRNLYAITITETWYTQLIQKIAEMPVHLMHASLDNDKDNISIRTVNENKTFLFEKMSDVAVPTVSPKIADILAKVINFKSGASIPLREDNKVIGTIMFLSTFSAEDLKTRLPLLELFSDFVSTSIINSKKYSKLQDEVKRLKHISK